MADLDDFFAKKDKKKKTKKGFSKANTDVLAKNLQESDRAAQKAEDKATGPLATSEATKLAFEDNPVLGVNGDSTSDANPGTTNPRVSSNESNQPGPHHTHPMPQTGGIESGSSQSGTHSKYFGIVNSETVS